MTRENIDSREAFTSEEEMAYNEAPYGWDMIEGDGDDGDYADYDEYLDEVDEYTEWQDYYGGDDWDHGQYDDCF